MLGRQALCLPHHVRTGSVIYKKAVVLLRVLVDPRLCHRTCSCPGTCRRHRGPVSRTDTAPPATKDESRVPNITAGTEPSLTSTWHVQAIYRDGGAERNPGDTRLIVSGGVFTVVVNSRCYNSAPSGAPVASPFLWSHPPEGITMRKLNQRPPDLSEPISDPDSATVARILRLHDETQELVEETRRVLEESHRLIERCRREAGRG
jgi:hypothetical protein